MTKATRKTKQDGCDGTLDARGGHDQGEKAKNSEEIQKRKSDHDRCSKDLFFRISMFCSFGPPEIAYRAVMAFD